MNKFIPFGKPNISSIEIELVKEVLESGILVHGDYTRRFEESFADRIGVKHAIAVSSCTAGLHLSLFVNNINKGSKVAVPAMTHVATSHVVELQGATPLFIDVDKKTGNIDVDLLEKEVSNQQIDAIIPVHYLGVPCNMNRINDIAKLNNLLVIEDCALSLDANYFGKKTGSLGDLGSFSFYPVKHMTSIEGGMVTTNNDDMAKAIKKCRAFGYNKELGQRTRPGIYDVDSLGFNYRMNEVEAAVGLTQIEKLDDSLKRRKRNFSIIKQYLNQTSYILSLPNDLENIESSFYCLNIILPRDSSIDRNSIQDFLKNKGIGTSIHYPCAVPLFSYYKNKYNYKTGQFPIAEWMASQTISIPLAPHVSEDNAHYIGSTLLNAITPI